MKHKRCSSNCLSRLHDKAWSPTCCAGFRVGPKGPRPTANTEPPTERYLLKNLFDVSRLNYCTCICCNLYNYTHTENTRNSLAPYLNLHTQFIYMLLPGDPPSVFAWPQASHMLNQAMPIWVMLLGGRPTWTALRVLAFCWVSHNWIVRRASWANSALV